MEMVNEALSGDTESYLVARKTLRELAQDDSAVTHESNLHAARFFALWMGGTLEDGIELHKRGNPEFNVPAEYLAGRVRI